MHMIWIKEKTIKKTTTLRQYLLALFGPLALNGVKTRLFRHL